MLDFIIQNWQAIIGILIALLGVILMILRLIPGEQGEGVIQSIADFLKKLTKNEGS